MPINLLGNWLVTSQDLRKALSVRKMSSSAECTEQFVTKHDTNVAVMPITTLH